MSLQLNRPGTDPSGLYLKMRGVSVPVILGDYEISVEDLLIAAHYVLTNADLEGESDSRLQFVQSIKAMEVTDGFNRGGRRLETTVPLAFQ